MSVLGIDSGFSKIGYAVIEDGRVRGAGTWRPKTHYKKLNEQSIHKIRVMLPIVEETITRFNVDAIAVEIVPTLPMGQRDKVLAIENLFRVVSAMKGVLYQEVPAVTVKKLVVS